MDQSEWKKAAMRPLMRVLDLPDPTLGQIRDAVVDAAEPLIRADERRRVEMNTVIDREPLIDMIDELVQQACYMPPEGMGEAYLDSMALSVYADAMHFLALEGRIKITQEYGRRVIAERIREE